MKASRVKVSPLSLSHTKSWDRFDADTYRTGLSIPELYGASISPPETMERYWQWSGFLSITGAGRDPGCQRRLIMRNRWWPRSEEHTSELQSLVRISYAVFCLKK